MHEKMIKLNLQIPQKSMETALNVKVYFAN